MTGAEWGLLIAGMVSAYVVSLLSVKFLMNYVRRHDFKAFGWYRIVVGGVILIMLLTGHNLTIA
jgi:undecaprenyl-diphosphatase